MLTIDEKFKSNADQILVHSTTIYILLSSAVNVLIVTFILFDTFGYRNKEILFYIILNLCKPN